MADSCVHCRSADVMHGFDTFQCLTCGKISSLDGHPLLPDSLHTAPNHDEALTQFGWPFADTDAAQARGAKVVATQWGIPFPADTDLIEGTFMSDTPPVEPAPEPEVPEAPEPEVPVEPTADTLVENIESAPVEAPPTEEVPA